MTLHQRLYRQDLIGYHFLLKGRILEVGKGIWEELGGTNGVNIIKNIICVYGILNEVIKI